MDILNHLSVVPAYMLAALMGGALWVDVRHDLCRLVTGRNVVIMAMAAWYLLEAIMVPEALRLYDQAQYNLAVLYVGLALAGFLLGYHQTSGCTLFAALGEKITFFDDERWLWRLVWIGAIVGFAPVVYFTGTQFAETLEGMMGMRATWGGVLGRSRYGDARAAFLMLETFVAGVAPFAGILLCNYPCPPRQTLGPGAGGPTRLTLVRWLICVLVIVWPMLRAFGSGNRAPIITSGGGLLAVFFWKATPAWRRRMIGAGLLCVPLFYQLMAAIVVSRVQGEFSWEAREKASYVGNEMFRELIFIISKVPSIADYQLGYSYYVQLVNPIPRFLWPDKPTLDSGILMAQLYGAMYASGETTLSISPGLIGEMYMNFGFVGIFGISAFGGWLVKGWDQLPRLFAYSLPTMVFYTAGLAVLFMTGRSFTMSSFYGLLSFALLAWWIRYCNPHAAAREVPAVGPL